MSVSLTGMYALRRQCKAATPTGRLLPSPQSVWCCGVMQSMTLNCLLLLLLQFGGLQVASPDLSKLCHAGFWQALIAANFLQGGYLPMARPSDWQLAESRAAGRAVAPLLQVPFL